ncbi:MAG: Gfo/Idh/MocA family oxidoreductase, partial [Cohnella sp.]|nr:Gfo/Idh/MocA family oxidoreductase [Cohnella sp.]
FHIPRTYASASEMFAKEEADGVFIVMPPHLLFDLVVAALRRKLNVFIEKPPGITSVITETFAREAAAHGVFGMAGFNRRFMPMVQYAKRLVEESGGITQLTGTFYKGNNTTFYDGNIEAIMADGIHCVDTLRYLAGTEQPIEEVYSLAGSCGGGSLNNAWNALIRFANGISAVLQLNYNTGGRIHTFEVHGCGISAYLDPDNQATVLENNGGYLNDNVQVRTTQEIAGSELRNDYYGFFAQDRYFIDCIRTKSEPHASFRDAVRTMKLIEAISRGTKAPISL